MTHESSFKTVFWHSTPHPLPGQLGLGTKVELRFVDPTGCMAVLVQKIATAKERRRNLAEIRKRDSRGLVGFLHGLRLESARNQVRKLQHLAIRRILDILLYSPKGSASEAVLILREDWDSIQSSERREVARKLREAHLFHVYAS